MAAETLRRAVARLSMAADRDISALFRQVSTAAVAREALADILPAIVEQYGAAAGALAATWYDQQREKAGVAGRFEATPVDLGASGAEALLGYGTAPLLTDEPDWTLARTLLSGGLQRRIANYSRQTVASAAIADPQAAGWSRVGSGECAFCAMLIARGAVYTEASADFASHDHCNCAAVPAFKGELRPVKPYTPSAKNITDADRARVREYIRTH